MNCLAGTSNLRQWREEGREEGKGRREKRKYMETHDGPISRPDKILSWLFYVTLSVPAMVLCYWLTLTASTNIRPICHNYVQSFLRNSNLSTCFFFPKYNLIPWIFLLSKHLTNFIFLKTWLYINISCIHPAKANSGISYPISVEY